jgi:hypothetical protein
MAGDACRCWQRVGSGVCPVKRAGVKAERARVNREIRRLRSELAELAERRSALSPASGQ